MNIYFIYILEFKPPSAKHIQPHKVSKWVATKTFWPFKLVAQSEIWFVFQKLQAMYFFSVWFSFLFFSLFSFWFFMTCLAKMSYSLCNKTGHLSLAGAKHGTCRSIVNRHCSAFSGVGCKCYAYAPMAPGWLSMVSAADRMSKQPCSSLWCDLTFYCFGLGFNLTS